MTPSWNPESLITQMGSKGADPKICLAQWSAFYQSLQLPDQALAFQS